MYAVEASNMSTGCERIVAGNNYKDIITVVHGRVENVTIKDLKHVDVIISEWMGFYLLHESMLTSLIFARDHWLAPDGLMVPSMASIYACPVNMDELHKESFGFWKDVEGFDMSALIPVAEGDVYSRPAISVIAPKQCLAAPKCIATFDIGFVQLDDIASVKAKLTFKFDHDSIMDGVACWFDVVFQNDDDKLCKTVTLSTSPLSEPTHWKQTTVLISQRLAVEKGQAFTCQLQFDQDDENERHYNIGLQLANDDDDGDGDDNDVQMTMEQHLLRAIQRNNVSADSST